MFQFSHSLIWMSLEFTPLYFRDPLAHLDQKDLLVPLERREKRESKVLVVNQENQAIWLVGLQWATTWDFQQCGILTCVDSDEPVQPSFKLRNSKWCSVSSITVQEYSSDKQWLWSDCVYGQVGLSLCWSHIPHCWKSHVVAHIVRHNTLNTALKHLFLFSYDKIKKVRKIKKHGNKELNSQINAV